MHDLVVRGGTVVDGTGHRTRTADVAVDEGLVVVVEDPAPVGPVLVVAGGRLHRILALEQEMISDEALPSPLRHERVAVE